MERYFDVLGTWRERHAEPELVSGRALDCAHFLPEEASEETVSELMVFFS